MAKSRNEFTVTFRLEDDGSLKAVGQEAERTGKKLKKGVTDQAHSADRAMKGLSNQSSNATKNFSKMSQGLAGGIVPIYATLAAQIFAVSAAFQFLKGAADYRMLLEGQRAYGVATGVMYKGLTITNNSGIHSKKAGEYGLMSILMLQNHLPKIITNQRNKN